MTFVYPDIVSVAIKKDGGAVVTAERECRLLYCKAFSCVDDARATASKVIVMDFPLDGGGPEQPF